MKKNIPYVYRIKLMQTGEFYYGVKYGKDSNPENFWKDYFTSSKTIEKRIDEYGIESFNIKIVKTFDNPKDAIHYEGKLIKRTFRSKKSLNFRYGMTYAGFGEVQLEKMLKTRNTPDENGITSYKRGGEKEKKLY